VSTLRIAVVRLTEIPVKVIRLNFRLLERILASGVLGIVLLEQVHLNGMEDG
jgi:hypothetical protein